MYCLFIQLWKCFIEVNLTKLFSKMENLYYFYYIHLYYFYFWRHIFNSIVFVCNNSFCYEYCKQGCIFQTKAILFNPYIINLPHQHKCKLLIQLIRSLTEKSKFCRFYVVEFIDKDWLTAFVVSCILESIRCSHKNYFC